VGIALGLVTIWWESYHQGTQGQLFAFGIPERVLVASRAIWFYLWKLIWPANLAFSYPRWSISATNARDYAWLLAAMMLAAIIWFWRPRATRAVTVAALFFVTTLGPVLGFIMLYTFRYSFVADHYQYLACIGPIALAGAGLGVASDRLEAPKVIQWIGCAALLGTMSVLTWNQCRIYSDAKTLWQETLLRNPASWMAHANLGVILFQQGKVEEGIEHYRKALELDPTYGEAHYDLANALVRLGRTEEAITHYEKAIDLSPLNARAHFNLGSILVQNNRLEEGIAHFRKAMVLNPGDAGIHNNLGIALLRSDKTDEAAAEFRVALGLNPENAEANYNLANVLVQKGRLEEAVTYYGRAAQSNPNNAAVHERLSEVLRRLNRLDEAESHARQAAELRRAR
ncbi:MAG TPA: tetratricopeptide repeat protein, partial [Chthoniobacterales bacterium]|nr:tetratricopeptide repeat protein [Chthoniobacterales bacterium]